MKREKKQTDSCPHLSWVGVNGMMCCRGCGKMRLPEPWENARGSVTAPVEVSPAAGREIYAGGVDALRIRVDGRDGDV